MQVHTQPWEQNGTEKNKTEWKIENIWLTGPESWHMFSDDKSNEFIWAQNKVVNQMIIIFFKI